MFSRSEGIRLDTMEDDPPIKLVGKLDDRWWWEFLWYREYWSFKVSPTKEKLERREICSESSVFYTHELVTRPRFRPGSTELAREIRNVILEVVAKFRKEVPGRKVGV